MIEYFTILRGGLICGGVVLVVLLPGVAVLVGVIVRGNEVLTAEPSSALATSERPTTGQMVSEQRLLLSLPTASVTLSRPETSR